MSKEKRNLKDFLNYVKSNLIGGNKTNSDNDVEIVDDLMSLRPPVVFNDVPEKVALYGMEGVNILPGETRILVENGVKKRYHCDRFVEGDGCRMYYIVEWPRYGSQTYINFKQPIGFIEPPADSYEYFKERFINDTIESDEPVDKQVVGIAIEDNGYDRDERKPKHITYLALTYRPKPLEYVLDGRKFVPKDTYIHYGSHREERILRKFDSPEELLDCLEKDYGELFGIKPKRGR